MELIDDERSSDDRFREDALSDFDVFYRISVQVAGARARAREIVSKTVLDAYRRWRSRAAELKPRVWVLCILRRILRATLDSEYSTAAEWQEKSHPEPVAVDPAFLEGLTPTRIRDAVSTLDVDLREVLAFHEIGELSYADLQYVLDTSRNEVGARLLHARRELQLHLNRQMQAAPSTP